MKSRLWLTVSLTVTSACGVPSPATSMPCEGERSSPTGSGEAKRTVIAKLEFGASPSFRWGVAGKLLLPPAVDGLWYRGPTTVGKTNS